MQKYNSSVIYSSIIERFKQVNRQENFLFLIHGISKILLSLVSIFLFFTLLEGVFNFTSPVRTVIFFLSLSLTLGAILFFLIIPLFKYLNLIRSFDEENIAKRVGKRFPSIKDRLLNSIQVFKSESNKYKYSSGFVESAIADLKTDIDRLNFSEIIDKDRIIKFFRISIATFLLSVVCVTISPNYFFSSFSRIVKFNQSFLPPAPFVFNISPGNIEVTKGDSVSIIVTISGEKQEEISLNIKPEEQKDFESNNLKSDVEGKFLFRLANLKINTEYFAETKGISSETYKIKVIDRPMIRNMRILLTFPSYTGLEPKYLDDNSGDIYAIPGTKAKMELNINKDIRSAKVVLSDSQNVLMKIFGRSISSEIKLMKNCSYHFDLEDEKGVKSIDPIEYQIKIIPDEYPSISIIEPGKNVDINEEMRLPMQMKIKDDYGFSKLRIGYKLIKTKYSMPQENYSFGDIPLSQLKGPEVEVPYIWNLVKLSLAPEDVISYFVEVFDNDVVSGPKSTKSSEYFVRFPSLDELFSKAEDVQKQAVKDLDKTLDDAKDLKKKVDEINQDLKKNKDNVDWQKKKKIEETLKRYEEIQKKIEEVAKNIDEMAKLMQENKLMSQETMDKYLELQKMFSEINSAEFSQAMKKMQESMQNLNPDAVKQAMQNFTFNEQNFRESIERTSSLLKRIIIEQKTDELVKRIDELTEKQENIKKDATKTDPNDKNKLNELSKKQEDLSKELSDAKKEMQDLEKRMQEFKNEMPLSDLQKIMENLANQNTEMKMEQASKQMQSGQMQQAQKTQNQVQQDLKSLLEQVQKMKKNLLEGQKQQVMNALNKALRELLEISKDEEDLRNQSQNSSPNSPRNRDLAQQQMNLQSDLVNVINQLYDLSQKSFAVTPQMGRAIGTALGKMNQATDNLAQRDNALASKAQTEAMSSLNQTAQQVQSAMNQMNQPGGQGGGLPSLLKQLQQLAGQQQGINQGMIPFGNGGQMTIEQQAALSRMLGEQQAVKKSLDELKEEANKYGNKDKILGDLDQVSKEMEEVIKDMKQNNVDKNTIQKQERILSRLLDAQRSMRERDFEKKRKSDAGKDFIRQSPKEIDINSLEGQDRLQRDLLKAIEEGYSKDYEELIKKYYEALQKVQQGKKNN